MSEDDYLAALQEYMIYKSIAVRQILRDMEDKENG